MLRRRSFPQAVVAATSGCVAAFCVAGLARAVEPAQTAVPTAVPYVARPLPLEDVRITDGPLKHAQQLDADYLLRLSPDRMLALLRERAGLRQKAPPYGGWDGEGRALTGHIAGHYLSAVSYMYQATGDDRFKQRADYIVAQLKEVQDARGDGYIGALLGDADRAASAAVPANGTTSPLVDGEMLFNEIKAGQIRSGGFDLNGMWSPWYVEHKLFAGLRDAYRLTGNRTALDLEVKFARWAQTIVGHLTATQAQRMLDTEFGGMNEVLVDLYADTGDQQWLTLAGQFHHDAVLNPLASGDDVLGGKHANTQIPKFIGSLARYLYTGEPAAGAAARNFWTAVVDHHTFATGGHGYDEYFGQPDQLSGQVDGTGQRSADLRTDESCNVYNMLKLTRRLFSLQPDVRYADFQERAIYNHVLASIDPVNGRTCYMVPIGPGVVHEYQSMFTDFTCCVGTGMENHALYGDGLYYASAGGADAARAGHLWIPFYVPSTATWSAAGVKLTMDTPFPAGDTATLMLNLAAPKRFTLSFRRPAWAGSGFALAVNGEPVHDLGKPDTFIDVTRQWTNGDSVSITLPQSLHAEALPDNPNRVALLWGPTVLAGEFGEQATDDQAEASSSRHMDFPVFPNADRPLEEWIKPVDGQPGTFRATTADGQVVTLSPFYASHDRRYGLYWDLFTPAQWSERQAAYAAEQAKQKKLAAATVAFVQVGQMQPERDFNFQGQGSTAIRDHGQPGRAGGQWISFDVPVDASAPAALQITTVPNAAAFDVSVGQTPLAKPTLHPEGDAHFVDLTYAVPHASIDGKKRVTIRFTAAGGHELPSIFGLRVLRASPSGSDPAVSP